MGYKIIKSTKSGRVGIETPYNARFVAKLKKIAGNAKWVAPTWFFDEIGLAQVTELADKYFSENHVKYHVTWDIDDSYEGPQVDGMDLINFERDSHKNAWNFPMPVVYLNQRLKSGGSRANPTLSGTLTVEVMAHPDAVFSPTPTSIEIVPVQPKVEVAPVEPTPFDRIRALGMDSADDAEITKTALAFLESALRVKCGEVSLEELLNQAL